MKKKLFLALAISVLFACLFALGISAVDVGGIDYTFSGTEATVSASNKNIAKENVVIPATVTNEGVSYTVTKIAAEAFYGNTTIKTLTFENIANIKSIGTSAFRDCSALTGTYSFTGLKEIGYHAFRNCATAEDSYFVVDLPVIETIGGGGTDTHVFSYSGLREIYIGNTINKICLNTFTDCTKLWKIEMPATVKEGFSFSSYTFDGCTSLKAFSIPEGVKSLPGRMFRNCSNLKAVYLPSTLTAINSGSQDHSTFANCTNVYFVSKPFTFTSDNDIPAKEDVYYFPANLVTVSGETFKVCKSLNKTLVFPVGVTSINNAWAFEAGINNPTLENIVFLGDMDKVSTGSWKMTGKIYFANPADKSSADFTSYSNSKSTVFCNADGNTTHLHSPRADKYCVATCTTAEGDYTFCFCGKELSFVKAENGEEALGHIYNEVVNKIFPTIEGGALDYYADATYVYACPQCDKDVDRVEKGTSLFTKSGFSANEEDMTDVVFIVYINYANIEAYLSENEGVEIVYGLVASANTTGTPLTYAGGKVEATSNTVKVDMTGLAYNKLTMRITNVGANELHCAGYVSYNSEISYLNHETVDNTADVVSISIINDMLFPPEDEGADEGAEEIPAE